VLSFDVYSATIGITIAIVFQFIALLFHVKIQQKESFILWWVLGLGLTVVGLLAAYLRTIPFLNSPALIVSNALTIFGQAAFLISIESFLNKEIKINSIKRAFGAVMVVLIYFSVFSDVTILRMLTTSIVLFTFSVLTIKRLNASKNAENKANINFLIGTFSINALYWFSRAGIVTLILPKYPEVYDVILMISYTVFTISLYFRNFRNNFVNE
jgi:hypothetical protein